MNRYATMLIKSPSAAAFAVAMLLFATTAAADVGSKLFPGLGDPGKPMSLTVLAGGANPDDAGKPAVISGRVARLQIVVTANYDSGQVRDWTHQVKYAVEPVDVVQVDATGLVQPLKDGQATIRVTGEGDLAGEIQVTVEKFANPDPINFANQITPIFTKYGCNAGGCHGKSGGQNGFRLSLLGFEPTEDYEYLVKEARGRRVFPASPDNSLLLLKAINAVPHGGGEKMKRDSHDYRLVRSWIESGMPYGQADDPTVTRIEVFPDVRIMSADASQQLKVIAHYTDGSTEDVTHTAQYEPNDKEMAEITEDGLVELMGRSGDVAVMVRYQSHVGVFRAMAPLGVTVSDLPEPKNFVDEVVFKKWKMMGLPPSEVCDDATFIRRVSIDLTGKLPTLERTKAFLEDPAADKRAKLVDELLASTDYADYFANKWSAILRNKRRKDTYMRGTFGFSAWIRQSIHQNKPYDQFVAEIIAASGEMSQHPPVSWYREVQKPEEQLEDVAQLFLGMRLQCAKCHHHPFEKWSQQDYYGFSAFFSQVGRKGGVDLDEQRIFHKRGIAQARNPKTGQNVKPTPLGSDPLNLPASEDPRVHLAQWLSQKDNPFFAHSLANRYWKHFFGRGLVEPEDDMRETNPASNPELLNALATHFIESGFDMKDLIRQITTSTVYQLSSDPNEYNLKDKQNFSRFYPRRLNAEVLLDAIDDVTDTQSSFNGLPATMRAVQIPDRGGVNSYFLTVFGAPEGSSVCECERTNDANLAQSLHLLNSDEIQRKLASGRAKVLAHDKTRTDAQKITELYYLAFSRQPNSEELNLAQDYLKKFEEKDKHLGYEDIVWALINTKEFLFNH